MVTAKQPVSDVNFDSVWQAHLSCSLSDVRVSIFQQFHQGSQPWLECHLRANLAFQSQNQFHPFNLPSPTLAHKRTILDIPLPETN
jgi:hypothetical protein